MTMTDAYNSLPTDAKWSCSFGNPGEGGFTEYYRTADGHRYVVRNGKYNDFPVEWTVERDR